MLIAVNLVDVVFEMLHSVFSKFCSKLRVLGCLESGGVDRGNPQGKDFRGVEGYLKGIWGNPSLVKIQGQTKKNNKQT